MVPFAAPQCYHHAQGQRAGPSWSCKACGTPVPCLGVAPQLYLTMSPLAMRMSSQNRPTVLCLLLSRLRSQSSNLLFFLPNSCLACKIQLGSQHLLKLVVWVCKHKYLILGSLKVFCFGVKEEDIWMWLVRSCHPDRP